MVELLVEVPFPVGVSVEFKVVSLPVMFGVVVELTGGTLVVDVCDTLLMMHCKVSVMCW